MAIIRYKCSRLGLVAAQFVVSFYVDNSETFWVHVQNLPACTVFDTLLSISKVLQFNKSQ